MEKSFKPHFNNRSTIKIKKNKNINIKIKFNKTKKIVIIFVIFDLHLRLVLQLMFRFTQLVFMTDFYSWHLKLMMINLYIDFYLNDGKLVYQKMSTLQFRFLYHI